MVYTGKLPLGKHNVSRIVAAADGLQMFDVAVGFKNVLTSLVNPRPSTPVSSMQTQTQTTNPTLTLLNKLPNTNPEGSDSPNKDESNSEETEPRGELKKEECEPESEDTEEPVYKRVRLGSPGQCQVVAMSTNLVSGK